MRGQAIPLFQVDFPPVNLAKSGILIDLTKFDVYSTSETETKFSIVIACWKLKTEYCINSFSKMSYLILE